MIWTLHAQILWVFLGGLLIGVDVGRVADGRTTVRASVARTVVILGIIAWNCYHGPLRTVLFPG